MRNTRYLFSHVLRPVGMGLMLAGLFGGPTSRQDVEPFDYPPDWVAQNPWGPREIAANATPGDSRRTRGETGMIVNAGGSLGMVSPITTPFTKARSARCSARASGAAANINAANPVLTGNMETNHMSRVRMAIAVLIAVVLGVAGIVYALDCGGDSSWMARVPGTCRPSAATRRR